MIEYENVVPGTYWGKHRDKKVIVAVYGTSPFLRADLWTPAFNKQGTIINNVDVSKGSIEFVEEIFGNWESG